MDISLHKIDSRDPRYAFVEGLLHSAFPACERRNDEAQRANADSQPMFNCCLIADGDDCVGLITYWLLGPMCYIEHFAVDPARRGAGIGARAFATLVGMLEEPVVLEVETPVDDITRRRVAMYRRLGMQLSDADYVQPPYRQGDSPVPMRLMTLGDVDIASAINLIHKHVYNIE